MLSTVYAVMITWTILGGSVYVSYYWTKPICEQEAAFLNSHPKEYTHVKAFCKEIMIEVKK